MPRLIHLALLAVLPSAFAWPTGGTGKSRCANATGIYGSYGGLNHTNHSGPTGTAPGTGLPLWSSTAKPTSSVYQESPVDSSNGSCEAETTVTETAFQTITVVALPASSSSVAAPVAAAWSSNSSAPYSNPNATSAYWPTGTPAGTGYAAPTGSGNSLPSGYHGHSGLHKGYSASRSSASASSASASSASSSSSSVAAAVAASSTSLTLSSTSTSSSAWISLSTSTSASLQVLPVAASSSTSISSKVTAYAPVTTVSSSVVATSSSTSASVAIASVIASSSSAAATARASSGGGNGKRGMAFNTGSLTDAFTSSSEVSWGYNWADSRSGLNSAFEYVPMCWCTGSHADGWSQAATSAIAAGSTHLLGFNEPDNSGQCNISPQDAATGWTSLMQPFAGTNVKLGSPAITNGGAPAGFTWLTSFLELCTDCQIDFVVVHWYDSATNFGYFQSYIEDAYKASNGKPLWITEFAGSGTVEEQINFLQVVMPWLDSLDYVERYSWFMVSDGSLITGTSMSDLGQTFGTYTSTTISSEIK
ncbi:MAG: hypothetical protein M1827_006300 [Pycnora praestabilis]|nr:MAG: hypothetical protein M1827_006300 [Pycnora praestabilis]